ncbi:MAG TPA: hypothetical protein VIO60_01905, partial [Rectinemataceae bacterium]
PLLGPSWVFKGPQGIPPASRANLFMNLYFAKPQGSDGVRTVKAHAPSGSGSLSVVVDAFEFEK